jgi:hypothetical protein
LKDTFKKIERATNLCQTMINPMEEQTKNF